VVKVESLKLRRQADFQSNDCVSSEGLVAEDWRGSGLSILTCGLFRIERRVRPKSSNGIGAQAWALASPGRLSFE